MIGDQGIRNLISIYLIIAMLATAFIGFIVFDGSEEDKSVEAATIRYVGGTGLGNYSTIQAGIDNTSTGDTVRVYAGTYNENIIVNKTISLIGNGSENTTIKGSGTGDVVKITADWVNISGFNITNSGTQVFPNYDAGIEVDHAENVTIENVNCSKNSIGIRPNYSNSTMIVNCTISSNSREGINSDKSHFLRITNNIIYSNSRWGIILVDSNRNIIDNNNFTNNVFEGLDLWKSNFCSVRNNSFIKNPDGMEVNRGHDNVIINNTFIDNNQGIHFSVDADNNLIANNFFNSSTFYDIHLSSSSSNTVENNTCLSQSSAGVHISGGSSSANIIRNNTITNASIGIHMITTNWTIVENNNCSNNYNGIYLQHTEFTKIANNTCNSITYRGIYLYRSDSNTIVNNTVTGNEYGILLEYSKSNTLTTNSLNNTGVFIRGDELGHWNSHAINTSNKVNGKPVYYWKDKTSGSVPTDGAQIILAHCSRADVKNQNIDNTVVGLEIGFSDNITVDNNDFSSNFDYGIYSYNSHWNTIKNNTCKSSGKAGIFLEESDWNTLINNNCSSNKNGIHLGEFSKSNTITYNYCFLNKYDGIRLIRNSYSNTIDNNTCNFNNRYGLYLEYIKSSTIENNIFNSNRFTGIQFNRSNSNMIKNNICNKNENGIINSGASAWDWGNYNTVINNTCTMNTQYGIYFRIADNNKIIKNICSNNHRGIELGGCQETHIFYNSILNNNIQGFQTGNNYWNNSDHEGNYWSDYTGLDNGAGGHVTGDGIGDTNIPHLGLDYYPLINPNGWLMPNTPTLKDPGEIDSDGYYNITWPQNYNTILYVLEMDENVTFDNPIEIYNNTGLLVNITNQTEGIYYYRLKAINDIYPSAWSNMVDIVIDYLPEIPNNLTEHIYPDGNAINLTWLPNSVDTKQYEIQYKMGDSGTWYILTSVSHPTYEDNHSGLTNGEIYYYKIKAVDHRDQNSNFSEIVSGVPEDTQAPSSPSGVNASAISDSVIRLTWKPNLEPDIEGYHIFMSDDKSGLPESFRLLITIDSKKHTYDVIDLVEQVEYFLVLKAFDEVPNDSLFSKVVSAIPSDQTDPSKPLGVTVTDPTIDSLKISWKANPDEDVIGYYLFWSSTQTGKLYKVNNNLTAETELTHNGLKEDTNYYYAVMAVDDAYRVSILSDRVSGKTLLGQHPPEIRNKIEDFSLNEDESEELAINLYYWFTDVNSEPLLFRCEGEQHLTIIIDQETGNVGIIPEKDWSGKETLTFYANDSYDEISDSVTITITPVNDAPTPVKIIEPNDGLKVEEGTPLTFKGQFDDPDLPYGDVLTVEWLSSKDGKLGELEKLEGINLSAGNHTISFEVMDSKGETSVDTIKITIYEKPSSQVAKSKGEESSSAVIIGIIMLVIIIIIIIILMLLLKRKKPPKTTMDNLGGVTIKPMKPSSIITQPSTQLVKPLEGQPDTISTQPGQAQSVSQAPPQPQVTQQQPGATPISIPSLQYPQLPAPPPVGPPQQTQQSPQIPQNPPQQFISSQPRAQVMPWGQQTVIQSPSMQTQRNDLK